MNFNLQFVDITLHVNATLEEGKWSPVLFAGGLANAKTPDSFFLF